MYNGILFAHFAYRWYTYLSTGTFGLGSLLSLHGFFRPDVQSLRHVFATIAAIVLPGKYVVFAQIAILHATMWLVSDDRDDRFARVAYPPEAYIVDVANVKRSYGYWQVVATTLSISGNADLAFMPLMAIQLSPVLCAAANKGIINHDTHHFIYNCALTLQNVGMILAVTRTTEGISAISFVVVCSLLANRLRHLSPHSIWTIAPPGALLIVYIYQQTVPLTVALYIKVALFGGGLIKRSTWIPMSWLLTRFIFHI